MLPWESKYIIGIFNSFHDLKLLNCIMWSHRLSYFDERNTRSLGVIWLKILLNFATQTTKIFQGFKKNTKKMGFADVYKCVAFWVPFAWTHLASLSDSLLWDNSTFFKTYLVQKFHKKEYRLKFSNWKLIID